MISERQNYQNIVISTMAFPPTQVMALFLQGIPVLIEHEENYQKKSLRNKYIIGTHQGKLQLSIPLKKGKNSNMNIQKVMICYNEDWPAQHWNSIQTAYGKSAWFLYYKNDLEQFIKTKAESLLDYNAAFLKLFSKWTSCPVSAEPTQMYFKNYAPETLDLRSADNINALINSPQRPYYQVFCRDSFLEGLSILDLIFHLGPETVNYLKSFNFPDFFKTY